MLPTVAESCDEVDPKEASDDEPDRDRSLERARGAPRRPRPAPPARALRGGPGPRGPHDPPAGRFPRRPLEEPRDGGDLRVPPRPREGSWPLGSHRGDVLRRAHQHHRGPRGASCGTPGRHADRARGARRRRGREGGARPHADLHDGAPRRQPPRPYGEDDHGRREHRHRRLGPRPAHGLRGPQALLAGRPDASLREQRRWRAPGGDAEAPRPRADALHHRVEDLHDAGDAHQCAERPRLAGREARRRGRGGQALRRREHEPPGRRRLRHRRRQQHVRLLGLGRRPLQPLERHRPAHRMHRRHGRLRGAPRGRATHGRPLQDRPARGEPPGAARPPRRVVRELLQRRDLRGAALRPVAPPHAGVASAGRHGEQRKARPQGRRRGRGLHDGPHRLGRAGHERAARLLSAHPPGDAPRPRRLPGAAPPPARARRPPRQAAREPAGPDRSADDRQDRRRGTRGARGGGPAR